MNRVILMGRLTADPEVRYTQNNLSISRFRLAVNRPGKPQEGQPGADFFDIVAWRGTADFVGKYFKKGMQVLVEGYLRNNSWQDQQGNNRYRTEIHVDNVYFADSKRDNNASNPAYGSQPPMPSAPQDSTGQPESGDGYYPFSGEDEDLPF
jgi:single-strand DNA-binding protein